MSDIILHIKDSYYFEVPRALWQSHATKPGELPPWMVRNDEQFQTLEADYLLARLEKIAPRSIDTASIKKEWEVWQTQSTKKTPNHGRPLDVFLEMQANEIALNAKAWSKATRSHAQDQVQAYLATGVRERYEWMHDVLHDPKSREEWNALKSETNSPEYLSKYLEQHGGEWSSDKVAQYNGALHGKILIPQYFGTLRNGYEPESGFCISKYMIIEFVVALLVGWFMVWLAGKASSGAAPRGRLWNAIEGLIEYVRKTALVAAMGEEDSRKFLPFLMTLFVFIFGMNLAGMIPWVGAPTASLGVTGALALMVFLVGLIFGIKAMGPMGYLKNICPDLGLPPVMAVFIVPLLWTIEFISLFMKHGILALRLLANMVAGHAVLLGLMGLAIGAHAVHMYVPGWSFLAGATAAGMVAMSLLELFIAFLQAAMFSFLAALFIGSSLHHH